MLTTIDLTPCIGTEIKAERKTLLDGSVSGDLRKLLEARGVLVFRDVNFTDEEQLTFTRTLGQIGDQMGKELIKISLDKEEQKERPYLADYLKGAFYWHIDKSNDDLPTRASLLNARKLSDTGGDTEWANTYAAYEALPEEDKKLIADLKVVHTIESSQRFVKPEPTYEELLGWQKMKPKVHPLVWTHKSGRKSLILGATAARVEGMNIEEGNLLLCRLREWTTQPQFVYRHKWKVGDLVIWDNTGTMHHVLAYPLDSGRLMHRTTLEGEERVA